ncbi:MAG: sigma 54-interacting transcriptional regulator, partial [Krumholzibacteria bacterium]|nr:sigma 54-interacting transcriptional regulator [Candidatus Krumholzibacteria bacterium]
MTPETERRDPTAPPSPAASADAVVRRILEATAAATGIPFCRALVRSLCGALGVKGAWVTEYDAERDRLVALAFWVDDGFVEHYEYAVAGTPCEPVIREAALVHFPDRLLDLFPDDPDLPPLDAVSYMGAALPDTDGDLMGHLALLDDKPLPADDLRRDIFRIFAAQAAAELRRLRRERAVQARERHLSAVFGGVLDAVIELDERFGVLRANAAAARVFGVAEANLGGRSFGPYLRPADRDRLRGLMTHLAESGPTAATWIPGGLEAVRAGGARFPAEATLSRVDVDGRPVFVLVLRDVDEKRAAEQRIRSLQAETEYLRDQVRGLQGATIVGTSPAMRPVLDAVAKVARTDATVLVCGETGTGKELVARAVHAASARARKPLITVNCAAVPANLIESEFFGHVKGAFTGATAPREGRFALADGGTLFLDEIGELPLDLQAKLLRVLQEGEFEPVGSSTPRLVDVRVIAATNRDLAAEAAAGRFREDLYYRLHVFPVAVPPLRERGDDVLLLADHFLQRCARHLGRPPAALDARGRQAVRTYRWPGNVRELQNLVERALILAGDGED